MEAVLLVGGKGTRLAPLTQVLPKPLLPVGGVPITEIIIRQLVHAGFSRIHMCTGYLADYIRLYFQDGERWKASIQYTQEEMPLGTAGPLGYLKGKLERDFLMMNGDLITTLDYARLYHFHLEQGAHLTLAAHQQEESNRFGCLQVEGNRLLGVEEKPKRISLVNMGIYVLHPSVLQVVPAGEYLDMPQLINQLIAAGKRVHVYTSEDLWMDVGCHDAFERAQRLFPDIRDRILPRGDE
jgi:NDP-sugar pyrophosphorylase family protein